MLNHVDLEQEEAASGKLKLLRCVSTVLTQTACEEEIGEEALQEAFLEVMEKEVECF